MSDPFYLNDYKIKNVDPSQYYLQDVVSSVYLRGQADRGFFDLSGYRFESTTAAADQRQQPVAAVLDYNKTIAVSPDATGGLGGEIKIDLNAANIAREEAAYQSSMANTLDQTYHLYDVCGTRRHGHRRLQHRRHDTTRRPPIRRRTIACCAASPATTRACPSRSRGSASSSTRSARPGRRSSSPASTAR